MNPLEGLLQICDQIDALQSSKIEGKQSAADLITTRQQISTLRENIYSQLPAGAEHSTASELDDHQLLLLAILFRRRLSGDDRMIDGGSLTGLLATAGFERSKSLEFLSANETLRSKGWLHAQAQAHVCDPIDTWFAPTNAALSLFWASKSPDAQDVSLVNGENVLRPYRDQEEFLWDLYGWRNQCMARAESLFPSDLPSGAPSPQFRILRQTARNTLTTIRGRLAITPGAEHFQIESFRRKHKLSLDHLLVVVHLMFSELVEGEPFISAIECLRVVSETRRDLFSRRNLVSPGGRLRRSGIVLDSGQNELGKALATDLTLADWVSENLVSGIDTPLKFDDQEFDDFIQGNDN